MKNKILALLATIGLASSVTAVEINENLSINGFIDGSYLNTDNTVGGVSTDSSNSAIDEVELNFIVSAGNVDGELHVDSQDGVLTGSDKFLEIEQVHFTYSFDNGASIQVGRIGSLLGFEREDPAGLYTYSRAYGTNDYNLGNVDETGTGVDDHNVLEGVRIAYAADNFSLALALGNGIGSTEENALNEDDYDYELSVSYNGIENLSLTAGVQTENTSDLKAGPATADIDLYTVNAAYTLDKLLLAGEYISREVDGAQDLNAYLLLADYDINDALGATLRYSEWETTATQTRDKFTFAANYALTSSLGTIVEFSTEEQRLFHGAWWAHRPVMPCTSSMSAEAHDFTPQRDDNNLVVMLGEEHPAEMLEWILTEELKCTRGKTCPLSAEAVIPDGTPGQKNGYIDNTTAAKRSVQASVGKTYADFENSLNSWLNNLMSEKNKNMSGDAIDRAGRDPSSSSFSEPEPEDTTLDRAHRYGSSDVSDTRGREVVRQLRSGLIAELGGPVVPEQEDSDIFDDSEESPAHSMWEQTVFRSPQQNRSCPVLEDDVIAGACLRLRHECGVATSGEEFCVRAVRGGEDERARGGDFRSRAARGGEDERARVNDCRSRAARGGEDERSSRAARGGEDEKARGDDCRSKEQPSDVPTGDGGAWNGAETTGETEFWQVVLRQHGQSELSNSLERGDTREPVDESEMSFCSYLISQEDTYDQGGESVFSLSESEESDIMETVRPRYGHDELLFSSSLSQRWGP